MPIERMVLRMAIFDYDSDYCYKNESCKFHIISQRTNTHTRKKNKTFIVLSIISLEYITFVRGAMLPTKYTNLKACLRGVSGDPSLIWPKFRQFCPFILHVSRRFLGGSTVSTTSFRGRTSSSSSSAGRRRFRSNNRKYITFSVLWLNEIYKEHTLVFPQ